MRLEDFIEQATVDVEANWSGPKPAHENRQHPDRPRYRVRYGDWAGQPKGSPPDFDRCCEDVWPNERGAIPHQCCNKAKHDPDHTGKPTACGIHSDAAKKKRRIKERARYLLNSARWKQRREGGDAQREAVALVKAIAAGHNDARGAAADLVARHPGVFND